MRGESGRHIDLAKQARHGESMFWACFAILPGGGGVDSKRSSRGLDAPVVGLRCSWASLRVACVPSSLQASTQYADCQRKLEAATSSLSASMARAAVAETNNAEVCVGVEGVCGGGGCRCVVWLAQFGLSPGHSRPGPGSCESLTPGLCAPLVCCFVFATLVFCATPLQLERSVHHFGQEVASLQAQLDARHAELAK